MQLIPREGGLIAERRPLEPLVWVAAKELHLSYHNMQIYSKYVYIVNNMVFGTMVT